MLRKILLLVVANLAILAGLLVFVEGFSSLTLKLWDTVKEGVSLRDNEVLERVHTRYDPLLGWVHIPDFLDPDLYGPGIDLQTNAQGFRERQDITPEPVAGNRRIFCIGDSFTLGFDVGNDYSWCHYLETLQPGVETVNMGQGGYGIDQAWLWYRRDAAPFRHDTVILGITDLDFERLQSREFLGYPKPFLALRDGRLTVTNEPLPERSFTTGSVLFNTFIAQFETYQLIARGLNKFRLKVSQPDLPMSWDEAMPILEAILDDLNSRPGITPVVVFLPITFDDDSDEVASREHREFLARATAARNIRFVDLVARRDSIRAAAGFPDLMTPLSPQSGRHYNEVGNYGVARVLQSELGLTPAKTETGVRPGFPSR